MSYPKVDEDESGRQKEMLSPLLSAAMLSPLPSVGKQLDEPGRAGRQAGGRVSFLLFLCFVSHENNSSAACFFQVRMVRGELVDEAGSSALEWIGLIRAARNSQEQTLEAVADLPGGQVPHSRLRAGMAPLSATCLPSQAS